MVIGGRPCGALRLTPRVRAEKHRDAAEMRQSGYSYSSENQGRWRIIAADSANEV